MTLKLFNTLIRNKEPFTPQKEGEVGFYACGPTVYNYAHLGNLRAYVFMDLLRRVLEYNHLEVNLVMNITDVGHLVSDADEGEDKMEKGAKREGKTVWDIAEFYTKEFKKDIKALNIKEPSIWCKATDHIKEQIELVQKIEANGYTYKTEDGIYFDTSKLKDYGKLIPGFKPEELEAGKRIEMADKKQKTDFALWKFSPKDEKRQMEWESPWGIGFPGWHIECTAMACKYLGEKFDIHTGGIDHIPIHHTNEIAQAEGAFGHDHVRFWLHNEFLVMDEGKMAKSTGGFLRLQTILDKGYDALDYRYFCMLTHYRKPLTFTWEGLDAARTARKRITNRVIELKNKSIVPDKLSDERLAYQKLFVKAINDDVNIPEALALVHDMLGSKMKEGEKLSLILDWDSVLGLRLAQAEKEEIEVPEEIKNLLEEREVARKAKNFKKSDEIRNKIREKGYDVDDTPEGPEVSRKSRIG